MRWLKENGEAWSRAVSSINRFSQEKYKENLVLADYCGQEGKLEQLTQLWDVFETAKKEIETLDEYPKMYLSGMVKGYQMILRVLQDDEVSYDEQIADMQQVVSKEIPQDTINKLGEKLEKQLTDSGYRQGTLPEKMASYLEDTVLPAEEVVPTTLAFLDRCCKACHEKVLQMPDGVGIEDVRGVRGAIYSGNSAYLGNYKGRLSFNLDRAWSMPTFANVLCHEGYPGHHAFYTRWDVLYQQDRFPLEAANYTKNTPTNSIFEGVPENAIHFLQWDMPEVLETEISAEQKQQFLIGRNIQDIHRMYQQNACHFVNCCGMKKDEAMQYVMASGMFTEASAASAYRFFTDATRRTYYPSYFYGRWLIHNAYRYFENKNPKEFYELIYDHPHTNETLIHEMKRRFGDVGDLFLPEV